ncbi:hypothetical protein M6B38_157880 [Iris pallida]|uniref:Uncharacterized protein n=1 Tax=Iris pallida TaxID=29817 RepID=A0AAX6F1E6_IRIPA|nr:hypothetical protein M6B38_157880 [Iris pallida]
MGRSGCSCLFVSSIGCVRRWGCMSEGAGTAVLVLARGKSNSLFEQLLEKYVAGVLVDIVPPWVRARRWWSFYFRMNLDYRDIVRLFPRFVRVYHVLY